MSLLRAGAGAPFDAIAVGGGGTVLFDTSAFATGVATGTTATFSTLDVGSGANGTTNLVLVAYLIFVNGSGTAAAPSMTWNGVSMTQIGTFIDIAGGASGTAFLFGLVNPATGNHGLVANWTGTNQVLVGGSSFVAADQTGGITTFRNVATNTGSGTPNSVTISSATGEKVVAAHVTTGNFAVASDNDLGFSNAGNICSGAANYGNGAASKTLTYSFSGGSIWASIGCSIKAA